MGLAADCWLSKTYCQYSADWDGISIDSLALDGFGVLPIDNLILKGEEKRLNLLYDSRA